MEKTSNSNPAEPLISVIMPVFNAEAFLSRSVESVLGQSYKNIELILVDDGSADGSGKICAEYALGDKRIKIISQKNSGPAAARNSGIRNATGDFVFFLDADDYIDKKTFEILITGYKEGRPDLVMGNFCKLENNGEIINQDAIFTPDGEPFAGDRKILAKEDVAGYVRHFLKHPSNHLISYCWGRLYKLSVIKNNNISANEEMRLFEDLVFNLEYLRHAGEIVFVNKPLYAYVMHNNYVSASMGIFDADSLAHDMNAFKTRATDFLSGTAGGGEISEIKKEVAHALIHYAIIFLVRSCRSVTGSNEEKIHTEISRIINAPVVAESLPYYSPSTGNSRILPLLMRLKLVNLIILYCRYKARKRYGRMEKS